MFNLIRSVLKLYKSVENILKAIEAPEKAIQKLIKTRNREQLATSKAFEIQRDKETRKRYKELLKEQKLQEHKTLIQQRKQARMNKTIQRKLNEFLQKGKKLNKSWIKDLEPTDSPYQWDMSTKSGVYRERISPHDVKKMFNSMKPGKVLWDTAWAYKRVNYFVRQKGTKMRLSTSDLLLLRGASKMSDTKRRKTVRKIYNRKNRKLERYQLKN